MALSTFLRGEIIGMSKAGKKSLDIATELEVNEGTVRGIIEQYQKRGRVETKKVPWSSTQAH
jgi:predicted transcriptional regulator